MIQKQTKSTPAAVSVESVMSALTVTVNRFRPALSEVELNALRLRVMDEKGISLNQYINFLEQSR